MRTTSPRITLLLSLAGISSMLCLLLFPDLVTEAVRDAMTLSVSRLIPLFFPYSVLSSLMIRRRWLPGRGPLSFLYGLPGDCEGVLFSGIAAGFPVGAEGSSRLLREGSITREEAGRLAAASSVPSPAFLTGAVGAMWGDVRFGWFLWICANLTLLVFSRMSRDRKSGRAAAKYAPVSGGFAQAPSPLSRDFSQAVSDAAGSCLVVTAFIAFFRTVSAVGSAVLPAAQVPLMLFLEISSGVRYGAGIGGTAGAAMTGLSAGCGGLSVFAQIAAHNADELPGGGFPLHPYLLSRIVLGAVLGSAGAVWFLLFSPDAVSPVFLDPPAPLSAVVPVFGGLILIRLLPRLAERTKRTVKENSFL